MLFYSISARVLISFLTRWRTNRLIRKKKAVEINEEFYYFSYLQIIAIFQTSLLDET